MPTSIHKQNRNNNQFVKIKDTNHYWCRRIQRLALKMNEQLFFYKKGLTEVKQLGNIRIR